MSAVAILLSWVFATLVSSASSAFRDFDDFWPLVASVSIEQDDDSQDDQPVAVIEEPRDDIACAAAGCEPEPDGNLPSLKEAAAVGVDYVTYEPVDAASLRFALFAPRLARAPPQTVSA